MHSSYRWLHTGNFTLSHRWLHILTQVTTHLYTGDYTLSHRWLHIFTQMTTHLYKGDFPYFTRLLYIFTQMTSHCHTGDYTLLCRWLDTFTQVFTQCHIGDYPVYSLTQITTGVSTLPDTMSQGMANEPLVTQVDVDSVLQINIVSQMTINCLTGTQLTNLQIFQ